MSFRLLTADGSNVEVPLVICNDGTAVHLDYYLCFTSHANELVFAMGGVWCYLPGEEERIKNREKYVPANGDAVFLLPRPAKNKDGTWMDLAEWKKYQR